MPRVRALAQHYGFLRLMEFDALRVLLQFYYDLNLYGPKQLCQSRVMIERNEFVRFIEFDGNDGTIESDGNDEFIETNRFNESLRLNELYRRRPAGGGRHRRTSKPSRREKCPLSDPGSTGSETRWPALFAGRESYDPDGGRSG